LDQKGSRFLCQKDSLYKLFLRILARRDFKCSPAFLTSVGSLKTESKQERVFVVSSRMKAEVAKLRKFLEASLPVRCCFCY
jgi:hypothetical protein